MVTFGSPLVPEGGDIPTVFHRGIEEEDDLVTVFFFDFVF